MSERTKLLLVGVGTHGATTWGHTVLPQLESAGLIECVGLVDLSLEQLKHANEKLGLPDNRLYQDFGTALKESEAEVMIDATPMQVREQISGAAFHAGLDVFMEKLVCMDRDACCRLFRNA